MAQQQKRSSNGRPKGQSVGDARLPRGLRIVEDQALPQKTTTHTAAAMKPEDAPLPPPSTLPARLHDLWAEVTGGLQRSGLLAAADGTLISVLVQELELYTMLVAECRSGGVTLEDDRGKALANPAFAQAASHAKVIADLAKTMGLTFVSRASIDAADPGKAQQQAGNIFAV